ncbi:unnamed protein product, partial [Closterium sp. NIES-53]
SGSGGGGSGSGGEGSGSGGGGGIGGGAGQGGATQREGFGGSPRQQQQRSRETPSAQQLREWYAGRGRSGGDGPCTYVLPIGGRRGETCGLPHNAQRFFGRLTDAWRAQFSDAVELPRWGDLLKQNVAIFDLDFEAILAAMYAVADSAEGDCYLCVPPDPGIEAAALGASASAAPCTSESAALGAGESALSGTTHSRFRPPHSKMGLLSAALACTLRIRSTSSLVSPCRRPHLLCGGRGRLAMRLCSVSGDLELLSAILPRTSCPPVPFPASSLAFPLTHLRGSFTTPARVVSSQDVTFDKSVSYYRLFPCRTASLPPPPPLFLAPGAPPVDPLPPQGAARGALLAGAGAGGAEPEVAESEGAEPGGAEPEVAESEGAEPGGAEPVRVEPGGAEPRCVESGGAEPGAAKPERAESGGPPGVPSRREPLSPQRLREWYARRCSRSTGAMGPAAGGASGAGAAGGAVGAGAAGGASGAGSAGGAGGAGAAGPGGARTGGTGAVGARCATGVGAVGAVAVATGGAAGAGAAGGTGAGGAAGVVAGDPGAEGTGAVSAVSGGVARPRPYYVPLLQQVLGLLPSTGPTPPLLRPPPVKSPSQLQPASPQPGPSPYSGPTSGLTERREPESQPVSPESRPRSPVRPVRTRRRIPHQCPPPIPDTHSMTLRPSTAPQRVPLPSPPASSLPALADPETDSLCTTSPTVTRLLATVVTDPSFESTAASALVAELVHFAAHSRLDYAAGLVAESESSSVCLPSVGGECALGTDVLEDRQEEFECFATAIPHLVSMMLAPKGDPDAPDIPTLRSYAEAIEGPYSSQWQAAMDAEMASWKSTSTYIDDVPPPGANILTGSFPAGTQWSLRRPVYDLRQAPREWHDILRTTLAALGFAPSTADPSLFLRTDATLPSFCVLVYVDDLVFATADTEALAHVKAQRTITLTQSHMVQQVLQRFGFTYSSPQSTPLPTGHSLSAPPSDESVEPSGPYPELVGCLITSGMGLVLGGRARVVLTGDADASRVDDLATQRSS